MEPITCKYYATTLGFVQKSVHNYYLCDLMKINIAHTMQSAYNEKGGALAVRRWFFPVV